MTASHRTVGSTTCCLPFLHCRNGNAPAYNEDRPLDHLPIRQPSEDIKSGVRMPVHLQNGNKMRKKGRRRRISHAQCQEICYHYKPGVEKQQQQQQLKPPCILLFVLHLNVLARGNEIYKAIQTSHRVEEGINTPSAVVYSLHLTPYQNVWQGLALQMLCVIAMDTKSLIILGAHAPGDS